MKFATTDILCELADTARVRDYNRQFDMEIVDALDPQGIHICIMQMIHEHAGGERVDPHMRTQWMLKVKDTMKPMVAFLDVDMDEYEDRLLTEDEVDRVQALTDWADAHMEENR